MKILVTGGFGFIGFHNVAGLLKEGHSVRIMAHRGHYPNIIFCKALQDSDVEGGRCEVELTGPDGNKSCFSLEAALGDVRDINACRKATKGVDAVVHHAAIASFNRSLEMPLETSQINVVGTRNMLEASVENGVKRFIFSSSAKVYGMNPDLPSREDIIPAPDNPYALSKMAGEELCRLFHERYGIETVSLRYFSVYGPGQKMESGYIGAIIKAVTEGHRPTLLGEENVERDFTYVEDVVQAISLALEKTEIKFGTYNVGCGKAYTLKESVDTMASILGKKLKPIYKRLLPGMAPRTMADLSNIKKDLGYEPGVYLEEGFRRTMEWYKTVYKGEEEEFL
jgi:nucleoside-diphosphate-sugar epimerase